MSKEVSVKSITIKIGAREISLDVAEAKKLKEALEDLFVSKAIREIWPNPSLSPRWHWYGPVWTSSDINDVRWKASWGEVLCTTSGNLALEVK